MRLVKIVGWSLLVVVGLLALGLATVVIVVKPNDYKPRIIQAVKERTGRELKLDGDLSWSLFPWLALELNHAELDNRAPFGTGPFVSVEKAQVGVRLLPLLLGQLDIGRVTLEGARLNLVKDERGVGNWEDLTQSTAEPAVRPTGSGGNASASIAALTLKNANFDYTDAQAGSRWRILKLQLETGRLRLGEPTSVQLECTLDQGEGTHPWPVALKIPALRVDKAQQILEAPAFTLNMAQARIAGSVTGSRILDAPAFSGRVELKQVAARALFESLGMQAPHTRDPKVLSTLSFESEFAGGIKGVQLINLKLALDDTRLTGQLGVPSFASGALDFNLAVDHVDLDRYLPPDTKAGQSSGQNSAAATADKPASEPVALPIKLLKGLNGKGTFQVGALSVAGVKLSAVKLGLAADHGLVQLNPVQAQLYDGQHRGAVTVDARSDPSKLTFEEHLSGIDCAPLLRDLLNNKRFSGRGAINIALTARGNDSTAWLQSLDGRLDFDVTNGAVEGTDLWYQLRRARALFATQSTAVSGDTGHTAFKTFKGTATVTQGVLDNRDLNVDMDYLKATGAGTVNLPSGAIDYHLKASIYRLPPEGAGAEMQDLKAVEIPVLITGTLKNIKVRPDLSEAVKAQAKKKLDEKKDELKGKLSDKLKQWLGGKQ